MKHRIRNSIEKKYAVIISLLIVGVVITCWCANALFLTRFYVSRRLETIQNVFEQFESVARSRGVESEEFKSVLESNAAAFNCEVLILDQDMNVVASNVVDEKDVSNMLIGYFFSPTEGTIYKELSRTEYYTTQITADMKGRAEYIELWGVMSTGNPIVIRSSVLGIHASTKVANTLLAYIGLFAIIVSYFIVMLVSKTITKPLLKMVDIADKMSKLDFDTKYEGNDESEIGLLGQHMNEMSDKLEKAISDLKTANTELEAELKKKIEIDEMRKDFINNVSHELKTPIALIQGYAEGLSDCVNDDEESRNFYCEVIEDETSKMNRLVKNLLELNELEFGNNNVNIERFDIIELIKNCLASSDILIKQQEISLEFDDSKSLFVWSDELRVEQVFNNYLSNAIHYSTGDKRMIRIKVEKKDNKVRVLVFNAGEPIPEDALPHIWTKFYKVDKARTREYGGSGVGLSIVKASMDALNQKYGVLNYDDGVEFWFEVDSE